MITNEQIIELLTALQTGRPDTKHIKIVIKRTLHNGNVETDVIEEGLE